MLEELYLYSLGQKGFILYSLERWSRAMETQRLMKITSHSVEGVVELTWISNEPWYRKWRRSTGRVKVLPYSQIFTDSSNVFVNIKNWAYPNFKDSVSLLRWLQPPIYGREVLLEWSRTVFVLVVFQNSSDSTSDLPVKTVQVWRSFAAISSSR